MNLFSFFFWFGLIEFCSFNFQKQKKIISQSMIEEKEPNLEIGFEIKQKTQKSEENFLGK